MDDKKIYYRVGRHVYCVNFLDTRNSTALLPSSEPFRLTEVPSAEEPLLFELNVDDNWRPASKGEEIGQFDCGGNNHGVYRLEDGSYQILVSDVRRRQCCLVQANADFSSATVCLVGTDTMRNFGLNNALMMMYAFSAADKMTVLMHASVVRKDGRGYLCLGVSGTGKSTQALIDVPILFNYGIGINRDLSIIPFVGPMVSLALTGNTHVSTVIGSGDYNWYGDNSSRSRFNLYAVFGADVKFSQFNLFGGYRLGLLDLDSRDNVALKYNGFFVGLGFTL